MKYFISMLFPTKTASDVILTLSKRAESNSSKEDHTIHLQPSYFGAPLLNRRNITILIALNAIIIKFRNQDTIIISDSKHKIESPFGFALHKKVSKKEYKKLVSTVFNNVRK